MVDLKMDKIEINVKYIIMSKYLKLFKIIHHSHYHLYYLLQY